MQGYKHLTAKKRQRILELKASGQSEAEIARRLGIHRNSVYRVFKAAGMQLPRIGPRVPELTEAEKAAVLQLLPTMGYQRAAAQLGLRETLVREISEQLGLRRRKGPISRWRDLPKDIRDKIDAEIRQHRNSAVDLAAKYGTSDGVILARGHRILECPKFRTGRSEPFTSNFPVKDFGPRLRKASAETDLNDFDKLAQVIAEECFHGVLPPYAETIRNAVMQAIPILRDAHEPQRKYIADQLLAALSQRIAAQDVSRCWLN